MTKRDAQAFGILGAAIFLALVYAGFGWTIAALSFGGYLICLAVGALIWRRSRRSHTKGE
jgi:hypothetical protein